jgi:hypothetical protein
LLTNFANNIGFCGATGMVTAPNGRPFNQISLPNLVVEPSQGDAFEMERTEVLFSFLFSGTLCDGTGGGWCS